MNNPTSIPVRLLRIAAVCSRLGLSRSTIYLRVNEGSSHFDPTFPKQVRLGRNSVAWVESEIEAWVAQQIVATRAEVPSTAASVSGARTVNFVDGAKANGAPPGPVRTTSASSNEPVPSPSEPKKSSCLSGANLNFREEHIKDMSRRRWS